MNRSLLRTLQNVSIHYKSNSLCRTQMHLISSVYSFKYMRAEFLIFFFTENETFSKNTALKNTEKKKRRQKVYKYVHTTLKSGQYM